MVAKAASDGLNRDNPVSLNVAAGDGHVVLKIGPVTLGVDPDTARTFAEAILSAVGEVKGDVYWVFRGSMSCDTGG